MKSKGENEKRHRVSSSGKEKWGVKESTSKKKGSATSEARGWQKNRRKVLKEKDHGGTEKSEREGGLEEGPG